MTTIDLQAATAVDGVSEGLSAYVARPPTPGPWPGVVVIHEAFGLDPVMRRQTDRMASAGYLAILPDLYSQGGRRRCLRATFMALRSGEGRAYRDIEAARSWLLAQEDCTGKVGVIGFCMGGAFALMAAPGHSFLNDGKAGAGWLQPVMRVLDIGPEPESAADAWSRIEAFFATHLR